MTNQINNNAANYFNDNWDRYLTTVKNNAIYHREMFSTFNEFLQQHFTQRSFSLIDVGCGDSSVIAHVLTDKSISKYIGMDAAVDVLKLASVSLADLSCDKEFICNDMLNGMHALDTKADIIFSSYAVHHLSQAQKVEFLQTCKNKLNAGGFMVMIDGVLAPNQTRDEWLGVLESRMKTTNPTITDDELESRMQHPRADDHPEMISTFEHIAKSQQWKSFAVLLNKGEFAFMVFGK